MEISTQFMGRKMDGFLNQGVNQEEEGSQYIQSLRTLSLQLNSPKSLYG